MQVRKVVLPLVILALGIGGFAALRVSKPKTPPVVAQEPSWRIETLIVAPATLSPTLTLTGKVESPELTRAAAPGPGRIGRVAVKIRSRALIAPSTTRT